MIIYTVAAEGEFITFTNGNNKRSYRKQGIREIITIGADGFLVLVNVDDKSMSYAYSEVEDPTTGLAFTTLEEFRVYMLNNLLLHF